MLTRLGTFEARARPLQGSIRENLLIIGLGQTGLKALNLLYDMLRVALPPRELQLHTRLLVIAQQPSFVHEQRLPRDARLLLTQEVIRWSEVPGRYATHGVARWWARTPNNPALQENPTASRPFSRLLIWNNAQLVGEKLFQLVGWLRETTQREQVNPTVLILASLSEGESSGMIFDVAGRLRHLLQVSSTPIYGVFTVASNFQNDDERYLAMAQTYATLKELDAINLTPELYPHELPFIGSSGSPTPQSKKPIFDQLCLTGDNKIPTPEPEAALAEFAVTWLLGTLTPDHKPLAPTVINSTDHLDRYRGYTSFGITRLVLPVRAALDLQAVDMAKSTLESLLINHMTPYKAWIQKVIARAHEELLTNDLSKHHLLKDRLTELRRQLHPRNLAGQVGGTKSGLFSLGGSPRGDTLLPVAQKEWRALLREMDIEELTPEGVSVRRDVLRTRIDDVLNQGFRRLTADLEQAVIALAYSEGNGLAWTYRVYQELSQQIQSILHATRNASDPAFEQAEYLRDLWYQSLGDREQVTEARAREMLAALTNWMGGQVRIGYWEQLRDYVDDIRDRLKLTIAKIPQEIERLRNLHFDLEAGLETASQFGPQFPAGALCTPDWIASGIKDITQQEHSPQALVSTIFEKWDARDYDALQQLAAFPLNILQPTRLTLQPQAQFTNIHDYVALHSEMPQVRQSLMQVQAQAVPAWNIKPETGKLEQIHMQALEAVREAPHTFKLINRTGQQVFQRHIPSPDPDEVTVIRMLQGWAAEHVKELREEYRRAYSRVAADNVPLHIDRRWETTMADLIQTSIRAEVSSLWDSTLEALNRGTEFAEPTLQSLINLLARALDADLSGLQVLPTQVQDIKLLILPMPPFRLKVPPPRCAFMILLAQRSGQEIAEDIFQIVTSTILEENFFFIINLPGRSDIESIIEPLRSQSYIPLVLSEADIKHLISAPKPATALRDIVIERIQLTAVSPFYTRAPVPDHMFFGREYEIADVRSKLNTGSVVLIGGRRIGKTSTLQKIMRTIQQNKDSRMVPYYLDCSNVLEYRHFFRRIQRDWGVAIDPASDPIEFDEVVELLHRRHPDKQPIFLLDEVDRLLKTDQAEGYNEPLFRTFRSLSNQKDCQFLFSGEKFLLRSVLDAHSVMFNFPKEVRLGPLDRTVVERLVKEPFEMLNIWLEDATYLIQQVYEISAGHPNIVQTICHALVNVLDQDLNANIITKEHLGKALDIHQVQVDIVTTIWGQMHPIAKLITLLWDEDVPRMSVQDIVQLLQRTGVRNLQTQILKGQVLPDLELYNFVRQRGQDYELLPVHFPTILAFMADKRMEIKATLEAINEVQDTRSYYGS